MSSAGLSSEGISSVRGDGGLGEAPSASTGVRLGEDGFVERVAAPEHGLRGALWGEPVKLSRVRFEKTATGNVRLVAEGPDVEMQLPVVFELEPSLCIERPNARRGPSSYVQLGDKRNASYAFRLRVTRLSQQIPYDRARGRGRPQRVAVAAGELMAVFDEGWIAGRFEAPVEQKGDWGQEHPCEASATAHNALSDPAVPPTNTIAGHVTERHETFQAGAIYAFAAASERYRPGFTFTFSNSRRTMTSLVFETPPKAGACTTRQAGRVMDPGVLAGSPAWFDLHFTAYTAPTETRPGKASGSVRFGWKSRVGGRAYGRFEDIPVKMGKIGIPGPQRCAEPGSD